MVKMTQAEWEAKGRALFGDDQMQWRFICPSCGYVASVQDYKDAGAPVSAVAFSCIGRWLDSEKEIFDETGGPCNYAGGGLIKINPIEIDGKSCFAFAEPKEVPAP